MRAPNLNLITIGTIAATGALLAIDAARVLGTGLEIEAVTVARASVMLCLLSFATIAWLATRAQFSLAGIVALLVGVAIALSASKVALIMFSAGCVVFLGSLLAPRAAAWTLGILVAMTVLCAPLIALAARHQDGGIVGLYGSARALSAVGHWGDLIFAEPWRLLTGHGFDTAQRARASGLFASDVPRDVIFEIWFELGLVGAVAMAALLFFAFLGATHLPRTLVAAATAELTAVFVFAFLGDGVLQVWWLSSLSLVAVAFTAVCHGQHRTVRPKARGRIFSGARPATT